MERLGCYISKSRAFIKTDVIGNNYVSLECERVSEEVKKYSSCLAEVDFFGTCGISTSVDREPENIRVTCYPEKVEYKDLGKHEDMVKSIEESDVKAKGEEIKEIKIDIDRWSEAIEATNEEVTGWLKSILQNYGIEPNEENTEFLEMFVKHWIRNQFRKEDVEDVEIDEGGFQKVYKFILRIAYDVNTAFRHT